MKQKVIYYTDENEEFSGITRNTIKIDKNYNYQKKGVIYKAGRFIVHYLITMPFAFIYNKVKFHHKVINKKALKSVRGGYFCFSNHTLMAGDAFIPNTVNFPKNTYTVVHPDNLSVKSTKLFIELNGAIPTPTEFSAMKNFLAAISIYSQKSAIQIYPEAHIWPYYTKIRPFKSTCFKFPVKLKKPCFAITNTFHKKRFSSKPKVITYVDGPFYADTNLSEREAEQKLAQTIYEAMTKRASLSTYEYIKYVKKEGV